jgi:hypothetical protein
MSTCACPIDTIEGAVIVGASGKMVKVLETTTSLMSVEIATPWSVGLFVIMGTK